jgi:hypothetical protein
MIGLPSVRAFVLRSRHDSKVGRVVWSLLISTVLCIAIGAAEPAAAQGAGDKTWELPGRIAIYDLQFGPAILKDAKWTFLGNTRTFRADAYGDRLTFMVRFAYKSSRSDIPLKFVIKLPDSRQYEKTVNLSSRNGQYAYRFSIHRPEDFLGSGSIYLYYGFSIVDVLDFTLIPGA